MRLVRALLTSSRDSSRAPRSCLCGVRAARCAAAQAAMARSRQLGAAGSKASSLLLAVALLALLRPGASLYSKKDDVEMLTEKNFEGARLRSRDTGPDAPARSSRARARARHPRPRPRRALTWHAAAAQSLCSTAQMYGWWNFMRLGCVLLAARGPPALTPLRMPRSAGTASRLRRSGRRRPRS